MTGSLPPFIRHLGFVSLVSLWRLGSLLFPCQLVFFDFESGQYSSQTSALRDDECDTVKGLSDDGHSYAGTVVRGVLRGDSE